MIEAIIHDAREGLTSPVLAVLRQAQRLDLSPKDAHLTVIGCWPLGDPPEGEGAEILHAVVIHGQWVPSDEPLPTITVFPPSRPYVRDRLAALEVGDLLTAHWASGAALLMLNREAFSCEIMALGAPLSEFHPPTWPLFR